MVSKPHFGSTFEGLPARITPIESVRALKSNLCNDSSDFSRVAVLA